MRVCPSDHLDADDRRAIRELLDAAFAGHFTDHDWAHALGGTHAILEADGQLTVIPRSR